MSDKDVEFADWISDLNDLYATAGEAEILAKVKEFRASVAHELAEKIRAHALEWQENYKYHWFEGQQDAADLIDPEVPGG